MVRKSWPLIVLVVALVALFFLMRRCALRLGFRPPEQPALAVTSPLLDHLSRLSFDDCMLELELLEVQRGTAHSPAERFEQHSAHYAICDKLRSRPKARPTLTPTSRPWWR